MTYVCLVSVFRVEVRKHFDCFASGLPVQLVLTIVFVVDKVSYEIIESTATTCAISHSEMMLKLRIICAK